MKIGIPKEIKNFESRVGMVPANVREMVHHGHEVFVQTNAGQGIGASDAEYTAAGARIVDTAQEVFDAAQMIVKVKEPQAVELDMLREDHVLFTYLHLAPDPQQTKRLQDIGCVAIAYETVTDAKGGLPLLAPMSEVAGRMSIQAGARCLENSQGGSGRLLGGVPGVRPAKVVVLGGGNVGLNAARMAAGLQAEVTVLDKSLPRLGFIDALYDGRMATVYANKETTEEHVLDADLVIGAALVPGAEAPKLVTRDMLKSMKPGSALVDVSIDQGGCFETSRPTTHAEPIYVEDAIVHYCVTNMPGAVAHTSTYALNNATLPFALALADKGWQQAMADDPHLAAGLNVQAGKIMHPAVAAAMEIQ